MGRDVARSSSGAREVFDRACDLLGFDLTSACFEGPAERLEQTDVQQPAIFVTSVAIWQAVLEAGGTLEAFALAGGLSLGEYTALHVAGALSFEDALLLVRRRGELMQNAALRHPGAMVSLLGCDAHVAQTLCEQVREGEVLVPANLNCPGQVVISGSRQACNRAVERAAEFGCRAVPLPVAGAFHSPLMAPAADGLMPVLEQTPFGAPAVPVVANVDASPHGDAGAIRRSLVRQLTEPVYWQRCVERMIEEGVRRFVEIGPGRVLTGLVRKISRHVSVLNVSSVESLEQVAAHSGARA